MTWTGLPSKSPRRGLQSRDDGDRVDGDDESVVVEAREVTVDEGDEETDEGTAEAEDDEDGDLLRVHMEPRKALAFAGRALEVVAAGRPPCPFCGQPLNPEGHICTRRNGYMH